MKHFIDFNTNSLLQFISFSCVIHCVLTPFIVAFLPFIGSFFHSFLFEMFIFTTSIISGSYIIYKGYCRHKRKRVTILFIIGVVFWLFHFILDLFHLHDFELFTLFVGSLFVVGSYYLNHKNIFSCNHLDGSN